MDEKNDLARWRTLLGELQVNLITSGTEPDKLSPFICTNHAILFILLLNFLQRFSVDAFKIYIYLRLFIESSLFVVSYDQLP